MLHTAHPTSIYNNDDNDNNNNINNVDYVGGLNKKYLSRLAHTKSQNSKKNMINIDS